MYIKNITLPSLSIEEAVLYSSDSPIETMKGLMKIPLEALHKVALQQIGEHEAYIEELEEKVKALQKKLEQKEDKFALTKEENRRIAIEVRREEVNARILRRFEESQQNNGKLKKKCNELSTELCMRMMEILQLKESHATILSQISGNYI